MDFKQFEYVLTVFEEKNFSRAAKKLYISQPSLSQYIGRIENRLGITIFDRTANPIKLTNEGEVYIETAKNILNLVEQMKRKFHDISKLNIGKLNIGLTPSKANYILPKILPCFKEKYPYIDLSITEASSSTLEELLAKDMVDICLMNLPLKNSNLEYVPILTERILLCAPHDYKFKKNSQNKDYPEIDISDLKDEWFILLKPDQRIRQINNILFYKAGFKPKILLETMNIETAQRLTSEGMGFCFVPESAIMYGLACQPNYFSLGNPALTWTIAIVFNKNAYKTKAAEAFAEITKTVVSKMTML